MKRLLLLPLLLLLAIYLFAQSTVLQKTTILTGTTKMGSVNISIPVTINAGSPGACDQTTSDSTCTSDTGNANILYFVPYITPANMGNPQWGSSCFMNWYSHDAANAQGCAIYDDASQSGTATTSGTTVTRVSGTFDTTHWGNGTTFVMCPTATNCELETISTVSANSITLTGTPATGCASACNWNVFTPGNYICSTFSGSGPSADGWESLSLSGCGTPLSNHQYWFVMISASGTQSVGRQSGGSWCPDGDLQHLHNFIILGSFTSNASYPSNASGAAQDPQDGCLAVYVPITYNYSSGYQFVTVTKTACDVGGANPNCVTFMAPTGSGHSLIVMCATESASSQTCTGVTTKTSGTTTDTLTKRGACTQITSGVPNPVQQCIYSIDRATAGANEVVATWSSNTVKSSVWVIEVAGTLSSSFDTSCYDTAVVNVSSFGASSCSMTNANPTELLIGIATDATLRSCCFYSGPYFTASGAWTKLMDGPGLGGNSPILSGMFFQVTLATGSNHLSGSQFNPSSPAIMTATAGFR